MQKQREHWGSKLGFVMAAAGSAIGLGTLWKFPYVVGENGGGAFVLIYILFTLLIGIPLFIAELLIGRVAQKGAVATFSTLSYPASPWKIAGWLGVIASFLIMSYYCVIAGWGLNYALMSLNQFWKDLSPAEIGSTFDVLSKSADITLFWQIAFIALTIGVVYPGIREGIEFWSKRVTSLLLALVVGLFIHNLTLPGFSETVHFIFNPDFTKLTPAAILEALGLSLFTLSLGQGVMITYGSYLDRKADLPKIALIVASMLIVVALLCTFAIFPVIFTFGGTPEAGFGLVFKTVPLLFAQLPGALLISTTFFVLFVFTALTSSIACVEVIVANLIDLVGWSRKKAALAVGIALFIFGIPSALSHTDLLFANWIKLYGMNFFETVDQLASNWLLPLAALLTALFTAFKVNSLTLKTEFNTETSLGFLYLPWRFFITWIVPGMILLILLHHAGCL
jgi:neurotransmitter:Na+ symporter, NSS family